MDDLEDGRLLAEQPEFVDVEVGVAQWMNERGFFVLEEDYAVNGEVWRVHKYDPDPFPSRPHAHCIGGKPRFIGCKLHLGTAQLFQGREALDRYLHKKQFMQLVALIRPKFPEIVLPLR